MFTSRSGSAPAPAIVLAAAIVAAATSLPGTADATEYRLGLITPPPHRWSVTAQDVATRVAEATDGRVELLIFPSGQLGNEAQMLQQLQSGALDFAFLTLGELANRDPDYGAFLAPYLVDDVAGARELLRGDTAKTLLGKTADFGLVGLGYAMAGLRQIVMAGDVESVEDLKGKKIRTVPLAPELSFWEVLGAAPTPMPLPSLYDAFANGQVDGMQIDFEGTWNSGYYEHAGTIMESGHMMFPMIAVASGRKWVTLQEADRVAIQAILDEELDGLVASYETIDAELLEKLRGTGVTVMKVDREFFGPAIDEWYGQWRERTPVLEALEAEAATSK